MYLYMLALHVTVWMKSFGLFPGGCCACWQGLTFRRNFAEISVFFPFPLVTGIRNFGIFRYISFQNSKFNKFRPKSTEIRRNSPKFRNGIPFPPITGIPPENEMVNPAWISHAFSDTSQQPGKSYHSVRCAMASSWCWFVVREKYYWLAGGC